MENTYFPSKRADSDEINHFVSNEIERLWKRLLGTSISNWSGICDEHRVRRWNWSGRHRKPEKSMAGNRIRRAHRPFRKRWSENNRRIQVRPSIDLLTSSISVSLAGKIPFGKKFQLQLLPFVGRSVPLDEDWGSYNFC